MSPSRLPQLKLLPLAAGGVIAAGIVCFALRPHSLSPVDGAAPSPHAAAPGRVAVRSQEAAASGGSLSGSDGRQEIAPPGPGAVTRVSDRSAVLAASSAARAGQEEARPGAAAAAAGSGAPAAGMAPGAHYDLPPSAAVHVRKTAPAGAATISSQEARIAQSAATLPLSHAVSDEQVQQAAPGVPQETIDHIRDQFEQIAGVGQLDPGDPEYARRWDDASRAAADRMRALYGWAAYAEMQRQAALAAAGAGR